MRVLWPTLTSRYAASFRIENIFLTEHCCTTRRAHPMRRTCSCTPFDCFFSPGVLEMVLHVHMSTVKPACSMYIPCDYSPASTIMAQLHTHNDILVLLYVSDSLILWCSYASGKSTTASNLPRNHLWNYARLNFLWVTSFPGVGRADRRLQSTPVEIAHCGWWGQGYSELTTNKTNIRPLDTPSSVLITLYTFALLPKIVPPLRVPPPRRKTPPAMKPQRFRSAGLVALSYYFMVAVLLSGRFTGGTASCVGSFHADGYCDDCNNTEECGTSTSTHWRFIDARYDIGSNWIFSGASRFGASTHHKTNMNSERMCLFIAMNKLIAWVVTKYVAHH